MTQIKIELAPGTFSALRLAPKEFSRELMTAAVVRWYAEGRIAQSKASEMLGISRAGFLAELFRRKVSASQVTIEELREELTHAG